ncbi:MAG: molybdenum cofactor biosynthesis protein MoaA [Thermoprotei archaeon]|nr:MAG: molybdenum cofactor biosynthesis protein MoaA [Thermoprotei archaeon]
MYDPLQLSRIVEKQVTRGNERKYYRFRGGRWYGGIATADCVGCNLKCVFCWGFQPRDNLRSYGRFYTPEKVFRELMSIAFRRGYKLVRVSGNEPTIGRRHLLELLEFFEQTEKLFILETNGILLGYNKNYAQELSKYTHIHVRVSLKGTDEEEFSKLTGAKPEAFRLQLKALGNLLNYNVSAHPAVMLSFSTYENLKRLKDRLREIDKLLVDKLEEEYVFLYPHVVEQLKKAGIKPRIAFTPDNIPVEFI